MIGVKGVQKVAEFIQIAIPWLGERAEEFAIVMKERREKMLKLVDTIIRHIIWQSD